MLTCDVCVIGAGPAGLALVDALPGDRSVIMIDSGGLDDDPAAQELSDAVVGGDRILGFDLRNTRHRQFGGNANTWSIKSRWDDDDWIIAVRFGTMTEHDFTTRAWVPNSGWPISRTDLEPWYRSACELTLAGRDDFDVPPVDDGVPLSSALFDRRLFRLAPRDVFLQTVEERVLADDRVRVIDHGTVVDLVVDPTTGDIARAIALIGDGPERIEIEARQFVLAMGAVENARLLLMADGGRGVGNDHDSVGRYFIDHPLFSIGHLVPTRPEVIADARFFDFGVDGDAVVHGHAAVNRATTERLGLLESAVSLFPRANPRRDHAAHGAKALTSERRAVRETAGDAAAAIAGLDYLARAAVMAKRRGQSILPGFGRGGWSDDPGSMLFDRFEVVVQTEEVPHRDGRVVLDDSVDRLGLRRPRVDVRIGERARFTAREVRRLIVDETIRTGYGHFVPAPAVEEDLPLPASLAHHTGTTRMSHRPQDGVVDRNCQVHGVPNVYVAGSSVFPTCGYVNPTLTIVALAQRLAAHLS